MSGQCVRLLLSATLLLALGACATPVPPAKAPALISLPLDAAIAPLAAPVQVIRAGWGSFRRGCAEVSGEVEAAGRRTAIAEPRRCMAISAGPDARGAWQVSGRVSEPPADDLSVAFRRDAGGVVTGWTLGGAAIATADTNQRKELESRARVLTGAPQAEGPYTARQGEAGVTRIAPPTLEGVVPARCAIIGGSLLRGRAVIVAECAGEGASSLPLAGLRLRGTTAVRALMAIDVETGLNTAGAVAITIGGTIYGPSGAVPATISILVRTALE